MPRILFGAVFAALLALTAAGFSAGVLAQYPPPIGNVQLSVSNINPSVNSNVTLTCVATGTDGSPLGDVPCDFSIAAEPGTDAALGSKTVTKTTDASGRATANLFTGSTPGPIVIDVTTGQMSSRVIVNVQAPAAQATPAPSEPPSTGVTPPSTGDGGLVDSISGLGASWGLLIAAALVSMPVLAYLLARRTLTSR